ncbi:hypothetical protein [Comamonas guangdongensis]|uniref:Outer membrane protein beta-barrel domain-containing protein n=1 Tax=Comamonas guangdongensis TaxID=510515 RepID=A0ABV3ZV17_9BURK
MNSSIALKSLKAAALLATSLLLAPAHAQTAAETAGDAWRLQLTPYVWMTGLDGHIRPFRGAPTAHVDKSFSELLDKLDAAAFVTGTARKGRYVFQGDFSHASTSDRSALPLGLTANAKVRQSSLTLTGGYNWSAGPRSSIDLMAGARLWDIKAEVQLPGLGAAGSNTSFIDPIIAARWRYDLAPRWSTLLYADAGGFGMGSRSTWQLLGLLNYQLKDSIHLSLGYRTLSVDYRHDGKRLDFSQSGPMLGGTFQFD